MGDTQPPDMIRLQRRTLDITKRQHIVQDIQPYIAAQTHLPVDGSSCVVAAWNAHIRNYMPNNGFDYGAAQ